ncbi:phage tail protein [Bradyrhizobium sp. AUGA SZCCT0222]|uniref:phage tail protein n=1 Tax=Bradyrhizobium sp. AUGA SZCCT0222 TaxID=2807668 RepID=UPI001BAD5F1F|nr:tail fiber protein [Bradyrhizobium sp. AUGA SZCCT0222]MBR1266844.1 phage tail protein [Bradyrhizobium sp. AUGA SZCCT0222]
MAQPYVGEIRMFAGNFAPAGWFLCDGQLISIAENEVLFQLIGTTYGGDGQSTFALPDLRGRLPLHQGGGFTLGQPGGVESVTLTVQQMAAHTHPMIASTSLGQDPNPSGKIVAQIGGGALPYIQDVTDTNLNAQAVTTVGGSLPHENMQPYLCVNFIISQFGIFPPPS